jgi:hypothetical protein
MANNSWEVHCNMFKEADEFIRQQDLKSLGRLYDILHQIIWHKGIDPVRWILENKQLVKEISPYKLGEQMPNELLERLQISLRKMEK